MTKPNFNHKVFIGAMFWIYVIAAGFISIFFIEKFWNSNIWDTTEGWGHFADYLGGFVNVLIGLGNLGLIVYISFQLADRDDRRNLVPLKHEALSKLGKCLDYMPRPVAVTKKDIKEFYKAQELFIKFVRDWQYMFSDSTEWTEASDDFTIDLLAYTNNLAQYIALSTAHSAESPQAKAKLEWLETYYEDQMMNRYGILRRQIIKSI